MRISSAVTQSIAGTYCPPVTHTTTASFTQVRGPVTESPVAKALGEGTAEHVVLERFK